MNGDTGSESARQAPRLPDCLLATKRNLRQRSRRPDEQAGQTPPKPGRGRRQCVMLSTVSA